MAVQFVAALYQAVARFDIAAEGVNEGGYAIDVGVAVLLRSEDARVVDIVERGEEGDVVVGKAQLPRVLRGEAHRAAEDRVVRPDPVLQEQREETDGEGQVETGVPTGETGIDGAEVTLEEQRLRVEVELFVEPPIAVAAAELEAGEFCIVLKRREEGVYSFGAGDLEVDVDVQPGRDLGNILAVVAGCRRPPSASRRRRRGPAAADSIYPGGCCSRRMTPEVYCWRPSSIGGRGGSTTIFAP